MKKTLTIIATIISLTVFGQSAEELLVSGIEKANNQKYKEAIIDFTKSIAKDANNAETYYNRGTIKMTISDFDGALLDYDKAIKLNPKQTNAYYNRAGIYVNTQQYKKALLDLNKVIELDEKFPSALTLRGQVKYALNDNNGSCNDFKRANEIGDKNAETYISKYCNETETDKESLSLKWPEDEKWKIAETQENDRLKFTELLRNGETFENWTEIGTMLVYKGVTGEDIEFRANLLYEQTKQQCPKAKFTIVDMDKKIEYPWIIFSIECPISGQLKTPESQLWLIIQGNASMYLVDRAIKEESLPSKIKLKWTNFFKTAKIISK